MNDRGVTLIELIVVTTVVAIIVGALAYNYQGWMGRYKTENAIKMLHSDLMESRTRASQRGRTYFADFPTTSSYRIIEDTNGNDALNAGAGDNVVPSFPKTLEHPLTWAGGWMQFDRRGIIYTQLGGLVASNPAPTDEAICMFTDFDGDKISDFDPDYDCIIVSQTRIVTGKLKKQDTDGGACDNANCVAK